MRLVLFTRRAFHNDTIVEAGESMLVADDVLLGAHMLDLTPDHVSEVPAFFAPPPPVSDEERARRTEEAIARAEASRAAAEAESSTATG